MRNRYVKATLFALGESSRSASRSAPTRWTELRIPTSPQPVRCRAPAPASSIRASARADYREPRSRFTSAPEPPS
jgi:hypothetical protein